MARLLTTALVLTACIASGAGLKCYECAGYTSTVASNDFYNTRNCEVESFEPEGMFVAGSAPGDGVDVVVREGKYCYKAYTYIGNDLFYIRSISTTMDTSILSAKGDIRNKLKETDSRRQAKYVAYFSFCDYDFCNAEDQAGSCSSGQFQCDNGFCISGSYKCDGDNHCGDNSDEFDCASESELKCYGCQGYNNGLPHDSNYNTRNCEDSTLRLDELSVVGNQPASDVDLVIPQGRYCVKQVLKQGDELVYVRYIFTTKDLLFDTHSRSSALRNASAMFSFKDGENDPYVSQEVYFCDTNFCNAASDAKASMVAVALSALMARLLINAAY